MSVIETFEMERMQCLYEHDVRYNLSDSGIQGLNLGELLAEASLSLDILDQDLGYPESPGSLTLRENIANWYPGSRPADVTVTNGCAEANFLTLWSLLDSGDLLALMTPNYMQAWGLARHFGAGCTSFRLSFSRDDTEWSLDIEALRRAVTPKTKAIMVCNPNNPTAAVLSPNEMETVVNLADGVGAWIIADETYRGGELDSDTTETFWGTYDKVIVTASASKSFGFPGLRLGWVIAPTHVTREVRRHRDYTSLMIGSLSDTLGCIVFDPSMREKLLARSRSLLRGNYLCIDQWLRSHEDLLACARPKAGAVVYAHYNLPVSSLELAHQLREKHSVLLVPGEQLGLDKGFRIGYGHHIDETLEGLERVGGVLRELAHSAT